MNTLTPTEIAILDAIARATETGKGIDQRVPLPMVESADAVWSLAERGLLVPRPPCDEAPPEDERPVWTTRFELTPKGRELLAEEGPLPRPEGWPEGRAYCGMFRGLIPDIPFEVFKENRRDMAGKYGEDWSDE